MPVPDELDYRLVTASSPSGYLRHIDWCILSSHPEVTRSCRHLPGHCVLNLFVASCDLEVFFRNILVGKVLWWLLTYHSEYNLIWNGLSYRVFEG